MISRISRAWRRRRASDWIAALENDNSAARGSSLERNAYSSGFRRHVANPVAP